MKTLIINDLHLGVKRQAGTTKQSRKDLEEWMLEEFKELLKVPHDRLLILGDLFDKRNVEEHVMAEVVAVLLEEDCVIAAGNHDLGGKDDHTMSSAEFVAKMSGCSWVSEPEMIGDVYIVPHMHDQEEFDKAVSRCPADTIMMVHCNIDSPFAHGDHSLNLSLQQMKDLSDRGVDVIAGHEHAKRQVMNVTVLGNQFPSSIADCQGGDKFCHVLDGEELEAIKTWDAAEFYSGTDIKDGCNFVEITGECELSEYSAIVREVAELRKRSSAFIVKNSVKVKELVAEKTDEEVTEFNIMEMLMEEIPESLKGDVKSCM